jgi:gluconate 2-dehydrogenase gamma chain
MDRREAIKRASWLMGGALSAPAIMGVLNGCTAKPTLDWKPVFLSEDQGILVSQVAEIILPKTDTPGAKEVGVPGFIDIMLKDVYSQEDKERFINGLKIFNQEAEKIYDDPFIALAPGQQQELVKKIHKEAIDDLKNLKPEAKRPFILMMKELTLLGFFTSEIGATKVLQYEPVPGVYKGCIPLSEAGNGKAWSTN